MLSILGNGSFNLAGNSVSFMGLGYISNIFTFIITLLVGYVIFRIVYYLLLKVSKKTIISLDEILINKSHRPILIMLILFSLYIASIDYHEYELSGLPLSSFYLAGFIVVATYWAVRLSNSVVDWYTEEIAPKTKTTFDDKFGPSIKKYLAFAIILMGLLMVLSAFKIEISPLLAGLGLGGLAVALALQETLKNLFAGIYVVSDRIFEPGDWVEVDGVEGTVDEIGWRSTRIITWTNEMYVIPNSKITNSVVQNYNKPTKRTTLIVPFTIEYGVDLKKVKNLIEKTAVKVLEKDDLYVKDSIVIRVNEFGDYGIQFKVLFSYGDFSKRFNIIEDIKIEVYNMFDKKNISIPYPTYDVHMQR